MFMKIIYYSKYLETMCVCSVIDDNRYAVYLRDIGFCIILIKIGMMKKFF